MPRDENLVDTGLGYAYYEHSKYPLIINVEEDEKKIHVEVVKWFKDKEIKKVELESKKLGVMTIEQKEDFILDAVDKFLKR